LIRQANPEQPILVICDNVSSHFANDVDTLVNELGIVRSALPRYSPDLNPIEQIWDCVKRDLSPLDAPDLDTCRELICDIFDAYADQLSFASAWIDRFLSIH
jgi:transposase